MNTDKKIFIYSARDKKLGEYYFYNGKGEHDWKSIFIAKQLHKGYVPKTETDLVEMYLELSANGEGVRPSETTIKQRLAIKLHKLIDNLLS